jgi:hypothetical protein
VFGVRITGSRYVVDAYDIYVCVIDRAVKSPLTVCILPEQFSLARDGASLDTLKQYCRASAYTILAIETTRGEVFGAFTSQTWRHHLGFYGSQPAFLWKMRHDRQTKCASLFDQAQLESEIDVFMFTGNNEYVQVCHHDLLAVGGDENVTIVESKGLSVDETILGLGSGDANSCSANRAGFGLALDKDLLRGTTSPTSTFKNPSLCGHGNATESFIVFGLEVWTFTPCRDVGSAEKLEMSKYFMKNASKVMDANELKFGSPEEIQHDFYRRVGITRSSGNIGT